MLRWLTKAFRLWPGSAKGLNPALRESEHAPSGSDSFSDFDRDIRKTQALDCMWGPELGNGMIPLREHITRLSSVAADLSGPWSGVADNLHYAASIEDLSADTDIHATSGWCSTAYEFEVAHSALTERFVAGVIVFNLVWSAYECAVEVAAGAAGEKRPKGALGRDLLRSVENRLPYLRVALYEAIGLCERENTAFPTAAMRQMIKSASLEGIAAEHLRVFRNALVHGAIPKPLPSDWGGRSISFLDRRKPDHPFISRKRPSNAPAHAGPNVAAG